MVLSYAAEVAAAIAAPGPAPSAMFTYLHRARVAGHGRWHPARFHWCQIEVAAKLDSLVVRMPAGQH